ncbi:hypothetical protein F5883DRAFT_565932 [Diaporthe sp. PMI_573]|nr:hypothetical protein F5883DRAFT_565932 [Diaporthaceae sp. PMI_573]
MYLLGLVHIILSTGAEVGHTIFFFLENWVLPRCWILPKAVNSSRALTRRLNTHAERVFESRYQSSIILVNPDLEK